MAADRRDAAGWRLRGGRRTLVARSARSPGRPARALLAVARPAQGSRNDEDDVAGQRARTSRDDIPARAWPGHGRELSILVLMVDAVSGVSGAACRLPESMPC